MTAPARSFYTDFGRFYAHPGVSRDPLDSQDRYQPNPSITNIIGIMDKKFLPPYYAKLVAEYATTHIDEIKSLVDRFGAQTAAGSLKAIVNRPNPAAEIGDQVHEAIDCFIKGTEIPELTSITAARMFDQFKHFMDEFKPKVIRSEYTVWSYEYGYAGTGDLLFQLDTGYWVVDTKTGSRIHPEVAMQTAAIGNADVILESDGTETPMIPISRYGVLHVRPMSVKFHELDHTGEAFEAFLGLKRVFDWKRYEYEQTIMKPLLFVRGK